MIFRCTQIPVYLAIAGRVLVLVRRTTAVYLAIPGRVLVPMFLLLVRPSAVYLVPGRVLVLVRRTTAVSLAILSKYLINVL